MTRKNKSLVLLHLQLSCASSLYSSFYPPSWHTLTLLFSNLIYYVIFLEAFTEIPQLMTEAYPMPLCLSLILSPTPLFSLSDYPSPFIRILLYFLLYNFLFFLTFMHSISICFFTPTYVLCVNGCTHDFKLAGVHFVCHLTYSVLQSLVSQVFITPPPKTHFNLHCNPSITIPLNQHINPLLGAQQWMVQQGVAC